MRLLLSRSSAGPCSAVNVKSSIRRRRWTTRTATATSIVALTRALWRLGTSPNVDGSDVRILHTVGELVIGRDTDQLVPEEAIPANHHILLVCNNISSGFVPSVVIDLRHY
jgi:hypothetical protein